MENGGSIPPVDVTLMNKVSTASKIRMHQTHEVICDYRNIPV